LLPPPLQGAKTSVYATADASWKDFMINHNESDLHNSGMKPRSSVSHVSALPIELTGRLLINCLKKI
jgi:hypothetical protein